MKIQLLRVNFMTLDDVDADIRGPSFFCGSILPAIFRPPNKMTIYCFCYVCFFLYFYCFQRPNSRLLWTVEIYQTLSQP